MNPTNVASLSAPRPRFTPRLNESGAKPLTFYAAAEHIELLQTDTLEYYLAVRDPYTGRVIVQIELDHVGTHRVEALMRGVNDR